MKMCSTKLMGLGVYVFDGSSNQGDVGNFSRAYLPETLEVRSLVRIWQVPFAGLVST